MRLDRVTSNFFIILVIIAVIIPFVIAVCSVQNPLYKNNLVSSADTDDTKIMIRVICDESTDYCELIKAFPEERLDETKLPTSPTPIQENFHYYVFVKTFHFHIASDDPLQSYIKIADTPPPISV